MVSVLGSQIKRAGELLKRGALEQISDYKNRFETMKDIHERFLVDLVASRFDSSAATRTGKEFFGTGKVRFAAVDGTQYVRPLFDLLIFFGGAYAATGHVEFRVDGDVSVTYDEGLIDRGRGLSSCVPIYVNEVPDVEPTLDEAYTAKPVDDRSILDNSRIADWIMAFSEFYLAYRLLADEKVQVLLMDRSLSGEHSALIRDTARRRWVERNSALLGLEVDGVKLTWYHLAYGRHRYSNEQLDLPPARGDTLRYRILYTIEKDGPLSATQLSQKLAIASEDQERKVKELLDEMSSEAVGYFERRGLSYQLASEYRNCWERLKKLTRTVGDQMFTLRSSTEPINPMKILKNGKPQYLTTLDIAFLTLYCFYMIIELSWKNRVLVLGITKDTAARDFRRQVIPVCCREDIFKKKIASAKLDNIPNTDRMFLQAASLYNHERMPVPWSLIEYDSCFKTIVPFLEEGYKRGYVSGAVRNRISPERLFVKSYLQLAQAAFDPQLRSNVLLVDRLAHGEFDNRPDTRLSFTHRYGNVHEPLNPIMFSSIKVANRLQNLIMTILVAMTSANIPEAFGHNIPLFVADNVAKWHYSELKKIIDSTGHWIVSNRDLRSFVFYMNTFREKRADIESTRRQAK